MKLKNILIAGTLLGGSTAAQADERSFGDGTLPEFLQEYDVNEDGTIDEEERQAIKAARKAARDERRAEIDTDGDGEISADEREAARDAIREEIAAKRAEKFGEIAGDDGVLSLAEFAALPPLARASENRVASIFARLDDDGNEEVSLEEFNARLRFHGSPSGPQPGDGRPGPAGPGPIDPPKPPSPPRR